MMEGLFGGMSLMPLCVLLVLAGLWVWFRWRHRRVIQIASKLPYSHRPWPIVGHAYVVFWGIMALTELAIDMTLTAMHKRLKTVCFWVGPLPLFVVHDANDVQMILTSSKTLNKADEYAMIKVGLDSGVGPFDQYLLNASASDWKIRRRYLSFLFHQNNLCHLVSMYNQNSRDLVDRMAKHVGQKSFDVFDYTMDTALKAVCDLVFGPDVDIDINTDTFRGLRDLVQTVPDLFIRQILIPWLRSEFVLKLIYRKKLKQLNAVWKEFSNTPIKSAKESSERKRKNNAHNIENLRYTSEIKERLNIIDVYTTMQQKFPQYSEIDLRAEIVMFYLTGTDTVSLGVASCFLALAQYPDIQDKLYSEINSTVGPDDDVTLEDINRMPYLDQVIKETLRRFTTVPFILRKPDQDFKLSTCVVPAGYTMIVSFFGLHMDPKIYPDPYKFDPERFTPENIAKNKNYYLPFSGGPRNCIAKTYALQLMKVMIVHVLRRFRLKTEMDIQKLKMKLVVMFISVDGYFISLEDRTEKSKR